MATTLSSLSAAKISRRTLSLTAVAIAMSACGGGGDDASPLPALPRITAHPADVSISAGDSVAFRVVAESSESVTYQWLRNGIVIVGATSAEYLLAAATASDTGSQFSVIVRNSAGSVESNKAILSVLPALDAGNISLAGGALASLGANHWFVAHAKSGDVFVWERDNKGRVVRYNAAGSRLPFAGSLQEFSPALGGIWQPSISVLEHSDGNIYLSFGHLTPSGQINSDRGAGGNIYRVTPEGVVSEVYNSAVSAVRITPHKLVEGPNGQLYTVNLNTVTLYRLSTSGDLTRIADLSATPIDEQNVVLRYSPWISLVSTEDHTVYVSFSQRFDYRVNPQGTLTPVTYGPAAARHLAAVGNTIYAYTLNSEGHAMVVRRASDGAISVVAGGIKPPMLGEPGYGDPVDLGPLPGWIPGFTQVFGAAPDGRIVMGGNSEESGGYSAPYFLLTPPSR